MSHVLQTHINKSCVICQNPILYRTRQWFNPLWPGDAIRRHWKPSIGSGNGSVPDSTRPLTETKRIRTKLQFSQCIYQGTMSQVIKIVQHTEAGAKWSLFSRRHFNCIFSNKNNWVSIKISLKSVPEGPVCNSPALIQIMAWRRSGDKPLSEPMIAIYWRIYASPGLSELSKPCVMWHKLTQLWQRLYIWHKEARGK